MRAQWLIQTIKLGKKSGRQVHLQTDDGINVCSSAFLQLYKLNKNYMVTCTKLVKQNAVAQGARKPKISSQAAIKCTAWFQNYATCSADRMPDSDTVLLPYKTTKLTVYETYKKENGVEDTVSRATFNNIWKWNFPNVKIKKVCCFSLVLQKYIIPSISWLVMSYGSIKSYACLMGVSRHELQEL